MNDIGEYREVPKEQIRPNDYNPNVMTDEEKNRLKTSMSRNGMLQTVLLYEQQPGDYIIVDGEHRWLTAEKGSDIRSIVVNDMDLEVIKDQLELKEGIKIENSKDVLKHLTVIMNKLRGTMTPTKLGDLIESLDVEETQKAALMLMDDQEIQFYSLVEEIEEAKMKVHEKEINQDKAEFIKWKVKAVEGLQSVILNMKDKEFMIDGMKKDLESLTMTINQKMQAVINCRYRDLDEEVLEPLPVKEEEPVTNVDSGSDGEGAIEESTKEAPVSEEQEPHI